MTRDLQAAYEKAEQAAQSLMAEKDDALQKVRDRYGDRLRKANDKASELQKRWLDAQAADALQDRPDGQAVADALGLELPG